MAAAGCFQLRLHEGLRDAVGRSQVEALIAVVIVGGIVLGLDALIQAVATRRDMTEKLASARRELADTEDFQATARLVKAYKNRASLSISGIAIDSDRDEIAILGPDSSIIEKFLSGRISREQLDQSIDETPLRNSVQSYLRRTIDAFDHPTEIDGKSLQRFIERHDRSCRLIDRGTKKTALVYSELIESEVIANGTSVTKTIRRGQFSGADIGGLVGESINAIIEKISGKQIPRQNPNGVYLRILINDIDDPVHVIDFTDNTHYPATTPEVALREAIQWHDILSVAINQSSTGEGSVQSGAKASITSIADKIEKLSMPADHDHNFREKRVATK
jgi:hypothetical protein